MKMKKILAGILAGAMTISAVTVTSLTLSAANEVNGIPIASPDGEFANTKFVDNSSPEMEGINLVGVNKVVFNAITWDINYGWNNGQFYTNSNGADYQSKSFGGSECTVDVTIEKAGRFSVEVGIDVTETGWFELGCGTGCKEGAFELDSIDFYKDSEKIGTWANNKFYSSISESTKTPVPIASPDGEFAETKFVDNSSPEMEGINLVGVNKVVFNAITWDINYGWNNGQFYTNSNGADYQSKSFGGTECTVDVTIEKAGRFFVEVSIDITETGWFEIGCGTGSQEGAFELESIDFYKDNEKIGTWANHVFTLDTIAVESINLDKETLTIEKGKTAQLEATVLPEDATDATVAWTSSEETVATVDENGEITALSEGTTTITAKAGEKEDTCEVTVASLSLKDLTLKAGDEAIAPEAAVKPEGLEIVWSTDDDEGTVITIDAATGKVTPVASGEANVTATIKGTTISAACKVTVTNPLTEIILDHINIVKGAEDSEITYTTVPARPDAFTATFESSDTAVFTVVEKSGKFYVHAVEVGEAELIAKVDNKEVGRCAVKVTDKLIPAESVELDKTTLMLEVGGTDVLKASVNPTDSTDKVVWTSDKPDIASVENGTVTANAVGTATITAKAGEQTAVCTVTVNAKTITITSVTLDKTEATVTEGETVELTATVKPDTATEDKTVTWTSSDETVATVKDGAVTGVKEGEATITAKAGAKEAACKITVTKKAEDTKPEETKPEDTKPEEPDPGKTFTTYELSEAERALLSDPKTTFTIKYNSPNGWNDIGFGASMADGTWASGALPAQQGEGTLVVTVEELIPQMKTDDKAITSLEGVSYFKIEGYNDTVFTSVEVKESTGEEPGPGDGEAVILFEGEGRENTDIKINTIKKYKDSAIITVTFTTAAAEPEGQTLDDCNFGTLAASNNTGAGGWWSQPVEAAYWNKNSSEGINAWGDAGTFKTTVADYVKNLQDCEDISEIATAWACPWNGTVINKVTIEGELIGGANPPDETGKPDDTTSPKPNVPSGGGSFSVPGGTTTTTPPDTTTPPTDSGSAVTPETTQLVNSDSTVKVEFAAGSVKAGAVLEVKKGAETATSATFDITLKLADAAIQPDGTLTITISVPANLLGAENYYVYRAEQDGTYTDMLAVFADGKVTFKTGHLSEYVISTVKLSDTGAEEGDSASAENSDNGGGNVNTGNAGQVPDEGNAGNTDSGKTDDKNVATGMVLALVPAAAAAAAVIISKKRK